MIPEQPLLTSVRVLVCMPLPHVLEQLPQPLHTLQVAQAAVLHCCDSDVTPEHPLPVSERVLVCVPPPHAAEQLPQVVHEPQVLVTGVGAGAGAGACGLRYDTQPTLTTSSSVLVGAMQNWGLPHQSLHAPAWQQYDESVALPTTLSQCMNPWQSLRPLHHASASCCLAVLHCCRAPPTGNVECWDAHLPVWGPL